MKEHIYYSTIREINVGEYLKVWYAAYYAEKMGVAVLDVKMLIDPPIGSEIQDIKVGKLFLPCF